MTARYDKLILRFADKFQTDNSSNLNKVTGSWVILLGSPLRNGKEK